MLRASSTVGRITRVRPEPHTSRSSASAPCRRRRPCSREMCTSVIPMSGRCMSAESRPKVTVRPAPTAIAATAEPEVGWRNMGDGERASSARASLFHSSTIRHLAVARLLVVALAFTAAPRVENRSERGHP